MNRDRGNGKIESEKRERERNFLEESAMIIDNNHDTID